MKDTIRHLGLDVHKDPIAYRIDEDRSAGGVVERPAVRTQGEAQVP
jgi:hypothetical protein